MSVETVNGHVLLPQYPDWNQRVRWGRSWQTEVGRSVAGGEVRRALRPGPRDSMTWQVTARDVVDQSELTAAIDSATRSGLACVPYWGRGVRVASVDNAYDVSLAQPAWAWLQAGDTVLALPRVDAPVAESILACVVYVDDNHLGFAEPLDGSWSSEYVVWPLLFGRLSTSDLSHRTNWHLSVSLTLKTLMSACCRSGSSFGTIVERVPSTVYRIGVIAINPITGEVYRGDSVTAGGRLLQDAATALPMSPVYWGLSASTTLDASSILALTSSSRNSAAGTYSFALPGVGRYLYFAWPDSGFGQATEFTLDGLAMAGDFAGVSEGYDLGGTDYPYKLVSVGGVNHRLYRSLNLLDASATIAVVVT